MNVRVVGLLLGAMLLSACHKRQVEVRTAPPTAQPTNQIAVQVANKLPQGVNVYVSLGGTDTFLRQVGANETVTIPIQGFAGGSSVTLKAVTVDGVRTYQRQNVVLNGTYVFPLP